MIVPIVEGDGDKTAVPLLLRRLLWSHGVYDVQPGAAIAAQGVGNLRAQGGERQYLERFLEYAARKPGASGIIVLIDADDDRDCPPRLSLARAHSASFRYFEKSVLNLAERARTGDTAVTPRDTTDV